MQYRYLQNLTKLLKLEIKDIHLHINFLLKKLNNLKRLVSKQKYDSVMINNFFDLTEQKSFKKFNNIEQKLNNKFVR